jgi:hypothetical protein
MSAIMGLRTYTSKANAYYAKLTEWRNLTAKQVHRKTLGDNSRRDDSKDICVMNVDSGEVRLEATFAS